MTIRIFQPALLVCFIATLSISDCAVANWVCDPTFYLPAAILHHGTNECLVAGFCQEAGHQFKWSTKKDSDATFTVHTDKHTWLETFVFPDEPCKFYVRCEITGEGGSIPGHEQLYVDITNMIYVVDVRYPIPSEVNQGSLFIAGAETVEPADVPVELSQLQLTPIDADNDYKILTSKDTYQNTPLMVTLTKYTGNGGSYLRSYELIARWFAERPESRFLNVATVGNPLVCSYHRSFILTIGGIDLAIPDNQDLTVTMSDSGQTACPDCWDAPSVDSTGQVSAIGNFHRVTPTVSDFSHVEVFSVWHDKIVVHEAVHLAQASALSYFDVTSYYANNFQGRTFCCQQKGQKRVAYEALKYRYDESVRYSEIEKVCDDEKMAFQVSDTIDPHYLECTPAQKLVHANMAVERYTSPLSALSDLVEQFYADWNNCHCH